MYRQMWRFLQFQNIQRLGEFQVKLEPLLILLTNLLAIFVHAIRPNWIIANIYLHCIHLSFNTDMSKLEFCLLQWNLDLRKPDLRKNLDLRKIVGTTDFLVHKLFDLRKIF